MDIVGFLLIKNPCLHRIKDATLNNETMQELMHTINKGWPHDKLFVPPSILPYYNLRDELAIQDGVIVQGDRVVIPSAVRA